MLPTHLDSFLDELIQIKLGQFAKSQFSGPIEGPKVSRLASAAPPGSRPGPSVKIAMGPGLAIPTAPQKGLKRAWELITGSRVKSLEQERERLHKREGLFRQAGEKSQDQFDSLPSFSFREDPSLRAARTSAIERANRAYGHIKQIQERRYALPDVDDEVMKRIGIGAGAAAVGTGGLAVGVPLAMEALSKKPAEEVAEPEVYTHPALRPKEKKRGKKKLAFQTSQFSGPLSMGSFKMTSAAPGFTMPGPSVKEAPSTGMRVNPASTTPSVKQAHLEVPFIDEAAGMCGPASLRAVTRYYGVRKHERDIAQLAGTDSKGTSGAGLVRAAKRLGFDATIKDNATIKDLKRETDAGRPVIVNWWSTDDGHYSVVRGVSKTNVHIMDPEPAKNIHIPHDTWNRIWFDTGERKGDPDLVKRRMIVVTPKVKQAGAGMGTNIPTVSSPKSLLSQTQRVGGAQSTPQPGPSIHSQVAPAPVGKGSPVGPAIPGATKT